MASEVPKSRLVHCPKCTQLLKVTANVKLYICGSCNAILQSRKRGGGSRARDVTEETDHIRKNETGQEAETNLGNQFFTADSNSKNDSVASADNEKIVPECISNSSCLSTSEELNTYNQGAVAETRKESYFVHGVGSEIPANNSNLPSMGKQVENSDAFSSLDEQSHHGKVMADSRHIVQESDSYQGKDFHGVPQNSEPNNLIVSMGMRNAAVTACESDGRMGKKVDNGKQEKKSQVHDYNSSALHSVETGKGRSTDGILSNSLVDKCPRTDYDSTSSCYGDGDDNNIQEHQLQVSRRPFNSQKTTDSLDQKGLQNQEPDSADSEIQSQAKGLLMKPSNEKQNSATSQSQNRGKLEESDVFHSVRSWVDPEKDIHATSVSIDNASYRKEPFDCRSNSSSLSYRQKDLSRSSSMNSYSSTKIHKLEHDKIELLEKVEELTNQLQTLCGVKGNVKERSPRKTSLLDTRNLAYPSDNNPSQQLQWRTRAMFPRNPTRSSYDPKKVMPYHYGHPKVPSAEDVMHSRHQVDYSRMHFSSQGCQYPLHMPALNSPYGYCPCPACSAHVYHCFHPPFSATSQQLHHLNRRTFQCDFVQHNTDEKHQLLRRHCRQMAGGAPFVVCSNCRKLLQLPLDFLQQAEGKLHKLQCGACAKVLTFSLRSRSLRSPIDIVSDHRSSSVVRYLHSSARVSDDYPPVESISYSDDYVNSIPRSHSTEGEPAMLNHQPFHSHVPDCHALHEANHSSYSSNSMPSTHHKIEMASKELRERGGNSRQLFGSPIKPSSEAGGSGESSFGGKTGEGTTPMLKSSPLHQLMGYSSLSQMIDGSFSCK